MLKAAGGQTINFRFGFIFNGSYFDPISESTPVDVLASVVRGETGSGNIVQSTVSMLNSSYKIDSIILPGSVVDGYVTLTFSFDETQYLSIGDQVYVYGVSSSCDGDYEVVSIVDDNTITAKKKASSIPSVGSLSISRLTLKNSAFFKRVSSSEYQFTYTIPEELHSGIYTVVIQTTYAGRNQVVEHFFEAINKSYTKTGNIISKKLENNIATIKTEENHFINSGEFVVIQETDNLLNGTYEVVEVPSSDTFQFRHASTQTIAETSVFGKYLVKNITGTSNQLSGPTTGSSVSFRPIYSDLDESSTNAILLVGHADGIELNEIYRVSSIQEAINLLGADMQSPLLRGVFDAYSCGAQSMYVLAAAPMSEYIEDISKRLTAMPHLVSSVSGVPVNFYQKYYERLSDSYNVIKGYDLIDIIVPLETSIVNTGSVNFISQLALHCYNFHEATGYVQLGVIGSRSGGVKESDIDILEANPIFQNKLTTYSVDGQIESDIGRYIIPVYGELNFSHSGFNRSYSSSAAAAFAGAMSSTPVYMGMIRRRLPGAMSVFGSDLSRSAHARLDNMGINVVYRTRKATRGYPYEVAVSNDSTMANQSSTLSKAPQMRLVAMVINEIKNISNDGVGKNAEEKVKNQVKNMLELLVSSRVIKSYSMQAYASKVERGFLIFELNLVSSLGLKNINFSVTTGPGV